MELGIRLYCQGVEEVEVERRRAVLCCLVRTVEGCLEINGLVNG